MKLHIYQLVWLSSQSWHRLECHDNLPFLIIFRLFLWNTKRVPVYNKCGGPDHIYSVSDVTGVFYLPRRCPRRAVPLCLPSLVPGSFRLWFPLGHGYQTSGQRLVRVGPSTLHCHQPESPHGSDWPSGRGKDLGPGPMATVICMYYWQQLLIWLMSLIDELLNAHKK